MLTAEHTETVPRFSFCVYSFPGQFWLEKGVPFTLPQAPYPLSSGCGSPVLFPLPPGAQPGGGGESSTSNGGSGE